MGSNHAQTKFRIIKIDRTEPRDLLISDDKVIYDPIQIREVLNMIDVGKSIKLQNWEIWKGHLPNQEAVTSFWRTFWKKKILVKFK